MTMKITEGYEGSERILPAGSVAELARLNRDYLSLLVGNTDDGAPPLAPAVLHGLRSASAAALDAMAACSYALFVLDAPPSATADPLQTACVQDPVAERYGTGAPDSGAWPAFTMAALSFAWLLGRQSPLSARVMLGFSATATTTIAAMDPWTMRRTALRQTQPLQPRWSRNPCFWPDLLRSAGTPDLLRLDLARLRGVQLLAADLHPRRGSPARRR
jgi:hypothetical protein